MTSIGKVVPIVGVIQNYAWGKKGTESEVAKLYKGSIPSFNIQPGSPYAELWFGTHPKGPSKLLENSELLTSWLSKNLQQASCNHSNELPFLLKVLSVDTALSIQIHPNKLEAGELHKWNPREYPDSNHKPEMAIALTSFEALCGFRPLQEIEHYFCDLDELKILTKLVTDSAHHVTTAGKIFQTELDFKNSFVSLMNCDAGIVKEQAASLNGRISKNNEMKSDPNHALFLRLHCQYPGDVGCFCVYFLNYVTLKPGEALFLQSNLPHAYIHGDCIECMANSDNVVRAGLTPKFRDVDTLCRLVKYENRQIRDVLFDSLAKDFKKYTMPATSTSSILLVTKGQAKLYCINKSNEDNDDNNGGRNSAGTNSLKSDTKPDRNDHRWKKIDIKTGLNKENGNGVLRNAPSEQKGNKAKNDSAKPGELN
ncbi:hypothetical protein HELRODRAFT_166495 [Helobdella robusta]|uniref:mannose-6-phosphate isomerase n=1 Tax=Helobdella robusta TaxID=6412 RepID=T1EY64_HELRO|nr:hypothetical protein HELRODRAFT_166495 [Helobdella robusta]ESO11493.1 hypothetical protein HELRODRAFT_166495 [Helobdella robusta]